MVRIDGDVIRLTGEVNDNLFNIETNRQDIDAHGILLGEHNLAISELESESPSPPRPPPPLDHHPATTPTRMRSLVVTSEL